MLYALLLKALSLWEKKDDFFFLLFLLCFCLWFVTSSCAWTFYKPVLLCSNSLPKKNLYIITLMENWSLRSDKEFISLFSGPRSKLNG